MHTKITHLPHSKIEILFELTQQEFSRFLERAQQELKKDIQMKGFRQGKVPSGLLKEKIPENQILVLAAEMAVREVFPSFVKKEGIEAIGSPQVEILKLAFGNPFSFRVRVDVLPQISLPDYKEIAKKVERGSVQVKDEEVEETLAWLQKSRPRFEDLNRPAQKGDFVEIEYQSPQIEEGKLYQDGFVLGEGGFVEGFEKEIEGLKKGEEKEFEVRFPEKSFSLSPNQRVAKNLAGKKVVFKLKLKSVKKRIIPALEDEFARGVGNFKNLQELKESVREGILKEKEIEERKKRREKILQEIVKNSRLEVPQTLVDFEKNQMLEDMKQRVKETLNLPFEEYLQSIQKTEQELRESFTEMALQRLKELLVLKEIGEREGVEVSEEEVESAINEFLKNFPDVQKAQREVDLERLKEYYKEVIFTEKTFRILESL